MAKKKKSFKKVTSALNNPFGEVSSDLNKMIGGMKKADSAMTRSTSGNISHVATRFNIVNPYDLDPSAMHKYLRRIARTANDRLLRLEKSGKNEESWAYKSAMSNLKDLGRRRFSYAAMEVDSMIKEIQRIERFTSAQSSTLSGLRVAQSSQWQKMRLKYQQKFGVDIQSIGLTKSDFYTFLNSQLGKDLIHDYGSDDIIEDMILTLYRNQRKTYSFENLMKDYQEFLASEASTLDAVRAKRAGVVGSYAEYMDKLNWRKNL